MNNDNLICIYYDEDMNMKSFIIAFFTLIYPLTSFSQSYDRQIIMDCEATPKIEPDYIPLKDIKRSNNLVRKPGSPARAKGTYITINGRVTDENCNPIQGAFIRIWQTDSDGNYEDVYTKKSEWDVVNKDYDKNFAYSGMAQTDNLGIFNFVTILPVSNDDDKAPHINFKVKHNDFEELYTMMFFNHHPKNEKDSNYNDLHYKERDLVTAKGHKLDPTDKLDGRVYEYNITLKGLSKYKTY